MSFSAYRRRHLENERCDRRGCRPNFLRAPLHRKLFVAMGLGIFFTVAVTGLVAHYTSRTPFDVQLRAIERFFAHQFGEAWDNSKSRNQLAKRAAEAFEVTVTLYSLDGEQLLVAGDATCESPSWTFAAIAAKKSEAEIGAGSVAPVKKGRIKVCASSHARFEHRTFLFGLTAAGLVLWLISGVIAHRLGTPLIRLANVTREIGEGNLSSRARLGRHHAGELGELAQSINDMAERIERQLSGQRELLAGVSHEIRTPLARLRVITEILRERQVSEDALSKIEREIEDIDELTGQLLANSRLEFESVDHEKLDPLQLAETALERASLDKKLVTLEGEPRNILGDPTLLERALINLVENAKRHGQGLLRLRVTFLPGRVRFTSEDEGPGFSGGDLDHVFTPFYRGRHSGKGASSLGLGLALVRRIAQAHGGSTRAQNRQEGGAEVWFDVRSDAASEA